MRIGIVCPYSWDIPGGVQAHVRDLAEQLIGLGHEVSVLAPGDEDMPGLPPYVVMAGKAVPIPYNGSVARLQFGIVSAPRGCAAGCATARFDVVHVHEPAPPSLSLLTCMIHDGPMVATFHAATARSRFLVDVRHRPAAVPGEAGRTDRGLLGCPQGHRRAPRRRRGRHPERCGGLALRRGRTAAPGYPRTGGTVGFIGRYDEPRKGMDVLVGAVELLAVAASGPAGARGRARRPEEFLDGLPPGLAARFELLGQVSEADKARMLRSVDVYCAPNTGQESFGVILLEAMAARTPIVASDIDAFRRVLAGGAAGELFPTGDPAGLAGALAARARRAATAAPSSSLPATRPSRRSTGRWSCTPCCACTNWPSPGRAFPPSGWPGG